MGIATYVTLVLLAAPPSGSASAAAATPSPPARPKAKLKAKVPARAKAEVQAKVQVQLPDRLKGWPIGWGLGTRQLWLDYARGRRIWRIGVGLLTTGVSGLVVSLTLGITAVIFMPRGVAQNLGSGLLVGFGLVSVILTYVGGSLVVKGKRIRDGAVLDILRFRARSGSVQAEVQVGLGSLQLGVRF